MPVKITSRVDGYRHSGKLHPAVATVHPDGTFTDEEIKALKAESILTVEILPASNNVPPDTQPVKDKDKVEDKDLNPGDDAGGKTREARAAELADMEYAEVCELAKTYGLAGAGRKRTVVEEDILAAEFKE